VPHFGPISWRDLVAALRQAGFDGPYSGGKHPIMVRGDVTVHIPNPHRGAIGRDLLKRVLDAAGITRDEWESL
jgi:HicA-like toxin of HicAB toxin-antitoxin system